MAVSSITLATTAGKTKKTTVPHHLATALGMNSGDYLEWILYENGAIVRLWNGVDDVDVILTKMTNPHPNTSSIRSSIPTRGIANPLGIEVGDKFIWTIKVHEDKPVLFVVKK